MNDWEELPEDVRAVTEVVVNELLRARRKHPPMASAHEGFAVLLEEVDELWEEVKHGTKIGQLEEVIQVGAMALRYMIDVLRNGKEE